ncbi:hypothetical protein CYLTODRAFT_360941, partial [Cylindrobasidium torrendii FP15055 ss-10]
MRGRGPGGPYTEEVRWLMRQLVRAGCAEDKVGFAILCCGSAFGITTHSLPSARMVGRAVREGGAYASMQLGYEISRSKAIGLSTDGTSHRGITIEGRHITLKAPEYRDENDDEMRWVTRAIGVERALDHTAERQLRGMHNSLSTIATVYSESPLAAMENDKLTLDGAISKTKFANMDHAADGKKYHRKYGAGKRDATVREFGRLRLEGLSAEVFAQEMCRVKSEDIEEFLPGLSLDTLKEERAKATLLVLRTRLGELEYDKLDGDKKTFADLFLFGGCCGHKDLNACKRGGEGMKADWKRNDAPEERPVPLPNKDKDSAIAEGGKAGLKALQSSDGGGIKFTEILGLLLRGKPGGKQAYQDLYKSFMVRRHFPNTPACRYQSHTYAAVDALEWGDLISELVLEVCAKKSNSGHQSHLESNVLKAFKCRATTADLCVLALYGVLVSWPYLSLVRTPRNGQPVNLLDLVDLHRQLPVLCMRLSIMFSSIFSTQKPEGDFEMFKSRFPWHDFTLDGNAPQNRRVLGKILDLHHEGKVPGLRWCFRSFFRHAAKGWVDFGEEFRPGGPIDSLPLSLRKLLFIPATNDANEGILGAWRVATRFQPNISPTNFTARTTCSRNDTESFIKAKCSENDALYVRQYVREM